MRYLGTGSGGRVLRLCFWPHFSAHILTREGDWGWGCSTKWGILQLQPSYLMLSMAIAVEKEVCSGVAPHVHCGHGTFCTFSEKLSPQNEIFRHR